MESSFTIQVISLSILSVGFCLVLYLVVKSHQLISRIETIINLSSGEVETAAQLTEKNTALTAQYQLESKALLVQYQNTLTVFNDNIDKLRKQMETLREQYDIEPIEVTEPEVHGEWFVG